jgi:acyl-CoA reductase-like NAD-dependent aldehyde dehydrogenase
VPREAISIYPGQHDVGAAVLEKCGRSLMFGGQAAVDQHRGNPRVQVHGPGFSKILIGDDLVDRWEDYLDLLVESVVTNGGRGCINASGIWASRHTPEIANAIARRLAAIQPLPPDHPDAQLAAFTVPGAAEAIARAIDADAAQPGVTDVTARYRKGGAHVQAGRADYLLPTVLHCDSPESPAAHKEYMFPFVSVVRCDEAKMVEAIGPTLVCTALTGNSALRRRLLDAVHVDRLNFGPVATTALNWLQPHEGNIVEFLYRPRAFQQAALAV